MTLMRAFAFGFPAFFSRKWFFLYLVSKSCKTVATTVGTALAYLIVPMRALGQDSWKIAAALMGRHIGGGSLFFSLPTFAMDVCNLIPLVSLFL